MQVPQGVAWNDKGDVARLIVGIAAKGKDHLSLLQRLTEVVMNEALAEQLATTTDKNDILKALNAGEQAPVEQLADYSTTAEARVVDEQGMHARPASLISERAASFSGTDIRIRNDQRTATAKSVASLLSMGASQGDVLIVSAEGPEAEKAVQVLAEMINRITRNNSPLQYLPKRDWDNSGSRFGSVVKAKEKLGFEACVPIEEGLKKTVDWTIKNLPIIEACIGKHAKAMSAYS